MLVQADDTLADIIKEQPMSLREAALNADLRKVRPHACSCSCGIALKERHDASSSDKEQIFSATKRRTSWLWTQ